MIPPGQTAQAANPNLISFQGKVVNADGTNVADGSYPFTFKLYSVSSGGSALWTETYTGGTDITVTAGVFQVELGSITTLPDFGSNSTLYLGVTFNNDSAGEMTPRIHLDSVPYALNSNELGGLTSAGFVQLSPGSAQTGNINITGSTTTSSLQSAPASALTITGNAASTWSTSAGNLTIQAASTSTLSLDTAGAGTVNIGTNASIVTLGAGSGAETVNLGNSSGTDTVNIATNGGSDIVNIGSSANPVSSLNAYGNAQFQTPTNSTTAFQIQNATGSESSDTLLSVSTVANAANLVTNPSFEQDTNGWAAKGNMAISRATSPAPPFGTEALQITNSGTPAALDGAKFPVTLSTNTTYAMSFYARIPSGSFSTMSFGRQADNGANPDTTCSTTSAPSTTTWLRFTCTFTTGASFTNGGGTYIMIGQNDTTARTWYVDGVSLEAVANGSFYKEGTLNLNGLALGNTLIQPAANSNQAFVVASVAGLNGLTVDTNGSALTTSFATTISNTALVSTTNSSALSVRNSTTAANLIRADTSTTNNSDTNGGFENSTTGYLSTKHAGSTLTADATAGNAYEGVDTGKVVTTASAVANSGISYNLTTGTMASATTYTVSFVAKLVTGQPAFTTLTAGRAEDGATETACVLNSTSLSLQWQGYTCTFTTGTTSGTPYFYIGQTDAGVAHQYYIDNIQFTTASSTTANYHEGNIQLNGVVTSPATFQSNSDGAGVFQIQNAEGNNVLNVDTNTGNLVTNSGFENGAGFWLSKGTATVSPDSTTSNVYQGDQSLKAAVTAATSGMVTSTFRLPMTINTQYQLTFYAKCDSTYATLTYGRQDVAGTDVNSTTSATCNTNWQQYTAHWTTGGTITNPNIYVNLGATTSGTIWLDDVSLIQTTTSGATNYNNANIALGGVLTSPTIFQNGSNSTTALQVQNASGVNLLVVDTADGQLAVGPSAVPANGVLTVGTNTTAATGGIYFGTDTNLYRSAANVLATDDSLTVGTNLSVTGTYNTNTFTSGALAFGAASTATIDANGSNQISIGGTSTGDVLLAGGSGATGCTVTNSNGNLTCTGNITGAATGSVGYWSRAGTTLQPATAGDNVTTTGNISTTSTGTITSAGLLTGNAGLTVSGGTTSISGGTINLNVSSNNPTNINTGSSTGAIGIGNNAAGAVTIASGATVSIQAGTAANAISIGTTASVNQLLIGSTNTTSSTTIQSGTNGTTFTPAGGSSNNGVLIKPGTDTTAALQVQNAAGANVLNYDTTIAVLSTKPFGASYVGGADVTGSTNSGTGDVQINATTISGRYEYVVKEGSNGTCSQAAGSAIGCELQVYDVSNPAKPTYLGGADSSGTTNGGASAIGMSSIYIAGHYAYVGTDGSAGTCSQTAGSAIGCELQVYDISNPSAPTYVGGADVSGTTNGGAGNNPVNSIFVSGRYLYETTDGSATGCLQTAGSAIGCELQVYDISNPAAPAYIGGADVSGTTNGGTGNLGINTVYVSGRYAYLGTAGSVGTCSATAGSAIGCELQVYDISNPSAPAYKGGADADGVTNGDTNGASYFSIVVSGNYAYVAKQAVVSPACSQTAGNAYGCELQVYNIANPSAPTYVGGADSSGSTNSGSGGDNFGSVFVAGHYAYIGKQLDSGTCSAVAGSAIGCELQVYDISNPAAPAYKGGDDVSGATNSGAGAENITTVTVAGGYIYAGTDGNTTGCSQTAGSAIGCDIQSYNAGGIDANSVIANSLEGGSLQVDNNASVFNQLTVGGSLTVGQNLAVQGDVGVSGAALFKDKTNSTTAFQVQNAAGATIVDTDTTANTLTVTGNLNLGQTAAPSSAPTVAINAVAGNLNGTYFYTTTFVTASGETNYGTVSGSVAPASQKVNLTAIPIGPAGMVTARKIYRTVAGAGSFGPFQLVTTIADNTTTTFTDNVADGSLGVTAFVDNRTASLQVGGSQAFLDSGTGFNTWVGLQAGSSNTTGVQNVALGDSALQHNTSGAAVTAIGEGAFTANTTGQNGTALGTNALTANTSGFNNTALGSYALSGNTTGGQNTAVGSNAGYTTVGANANVTGSGNTFIGYQSGPGSATQLQNATAIGAASTVSQNDSLVLGCISGINGCSASTEVGIGTATPGFNLDVVGNAAIQDTANFAFQVQNASGSSTTLDVDTNNNGVSIGDASNPPDAALSVRTAGQNAVVDVYGVSSGTDYGAIQVSSVGNLTNASGRALLLQPNGGNVQIGSSSGTNSTAEFSVQNAAGGQVLNVDSTNTNITLGGVNSPTLETWNTTTALSPAMGFHASVTANGYVYEIGGRNTAGTGVTTVNYARLNANGSIPASGTGTWTSTTALIGALYSEDAVYSNGYIYVMGGKNASNVAQKLVYSARVNSDGTLGSWTQLTNDLTPCGYIGTTSNQVYQAGSATANGYIYMVGGRDDPNAESQVCYARANPDGTTGTWISTTSLGANNVQQVAVTVANGFIYAIGGWGGGGNTNQNIVQYAPLNSTTGAVGSWTTSANHLTSVLCSATAAVANGYLYAIGGLSDSACSSTATTTVQYTQLNGDGSFGTWSATTSLPLARDDQSTIVANGYIYAIGGSNAGGPSGDQTTVYYSSVPRIEVGGALDLVGLGGENLNNGGTGGELTAGNTNIIGNLSVNGAANILQGVSIGGNLSVGSTNTLLGVDTSGDSVNIGITGTTAAASTVNVANTTGNATQVVNIGATNSASNAVLIQGGTGASAISLQAAGTGTIAIGTTNINTVTVGSTANTGTLTFGQSTAGETISIGNGNVATGKTNTISIGATATTSGKDVITIGNEVAASSLALQGGTGNISADVVAGSSVLLGTLNSEIVTIGNTSNTNTLTLGQSTQGETINIGNGNVATGKTNTITIGHTATSTGLDAITIGSNVAASSLALLAGTGNVTIQGAAGTTFGIGNTATTTGAITIGGSGASTGTITLGQSTGTEITNIQNVAVAAGKTNTINIGATNPASTGVIAINIGASNSSTGVDTVTIKAGGSGRSQGPSVTLGNVATQSNAVCSSLANNTAPTAGTAYELEDCNVAPAIDYAEFYPTDGTSTYGDIMTLSNQSVQEYDTDGQGNILYNAPKRTVSKLVKATQAYAGNVIGVISNNYDEFTSTGLGIVSQSDNPMPIALNGRIPVNISPSSDPIAVGDYITTSSDPGKGIKATQAGEVIGKALASWDPNSGQTQIMVFVEQGYYAGPSQAQTLQSVGDLNASGTITAATLQVNGTATTQDLNVNGMATLQSANVIGTATVAQLLATNTTTQDISVTGTATVNNLTVTGATTLASLSVSGTATVGDLIVQNSITTATLKVSGLAEVSQLQVDNQINLGSASEDPTQESPHPITKRFKATKPIAAGSVVIADTQSGYATTTTTAGDTRVVGVAVTAAANAGDVIEVAIGGTAKVLVSGTPQVGQLLHADSKEGDASTVAKPSPGEVVGKVLGSVDQSGEVMAIVTLE